MEEQQPKKKVIARDAKHHLAELERLSMFHQQGILPPLGVVRKNQLQTMINDIIRKRSEAKLDVSAIVERNDRIATMRAPPPDPIDLAHFLKTGKVPDDDTALADFQVDIEEFARQYDDHNGHLSDGTAFEDIPLPEAEPNAFNFGPPLIPITVPDFRQLLPPEPDQPKYSFPTSTGFVQTSAPVPKPSAPKQKPTTADSKNVLPSLERPETIPAAAVISAAPQVRNLRTEAAVFVPSAVRKRKQAAPVVEPPKVLHEPAVEQPQSKSPEPTKHFTPPAAPPPISFNINAAPDIDDDD